MSRDSQARRPRLAPAADDHRAARAERQLTDRQQEVLAYVSACIEQRGYPPTLREIGEHMGISSTNGVNDHLKALERKGYLARDDMKSRGLRRVGGSGQVIEVPLLGRVSAGQPALAIEHREDSVKIDRFFVGPARDVFALRVHGDSMIEDGIFNGDFIFVRKQLTAEPGQVVVAMIDEEATVKRFYPEGDRIRFQPANSAMQPIYVTRSQFRSVDLLGVVIGVYRKLS
jgi:repressor LexA